MHTVVAVPLLLAVSTLGLKVLTRHGLGPDILKIIITSSLYSLVFTSRRRRGRLQPPVLAFIPVHYVTLMSWFQS